MERKVANEEEGGGGRKGKLVFEDAEFSLRNSAGKNNSILLL